MFRVLIALLSSFVVIDSLKSDVKHTTTAKGIADSLYCHGGERIKNSGIVFIKPHANLPSVRDLVKQKLDKAGIHVVMEWEVSAKEMQDKKLIDNHYFSIASKATLKTPDKLNVPLKIFEDFFGESWSKVLSEGRAVNALQACKRFQCDAQTLNEAWRNSESISKVVKLGGGFYCGLVTVGNQSPLYVFNAFFLNMRDKFVGDTDNSIYCYEIEWDPIVLSWADFRKKLLGATDPNAACKGSIRKELLKRYKELGLASRPDKSNNGVHGSASPFEGLVEKANWGAKPYDKDGFGKQLILQGIKVKILKTWSHDPHVILPESSSPVSLFDALEDLDAAACINKLVRISEIN